MSEQLWSDERISKQLGIVSDAQIDYASSFIVGMDVASRACRSIRDEYEAKLTHDGWPLAQARAVRIVELESRIRELEAALANAQQWRTIEDDEVWLRLPDEAGGIL